ncbi:MAG: tRNA lysidine(34) synthetase TilS [Firmicutes bacterium]|nr:tRNA lysidine(34) synthetase TilS [Bacillota bacterium]MDY6160301.1 tRNA lysidine(34) synthetase TilS [Candidatus Faecousia sp.]
MLNKLSAALRELVQPGERVFCAVSGGADSVALLFGMYLLREKFQFDLSAAHFNHHLRGEESDRDAEFVQEFCRGYGIPLVLGQAQVLPGKKGLEAAAREARYAFLRSLPGKVATAHTADDNAETVLMHLIRGTGLKGLGGIAPVNGSVIRPMLSVTRQEVEAFLQEYHLPHREDSSNASDDFLRNRLRHHVMPLLQMENPGVSLAISAAALRLRQDEEYLQSQLEKELPPVSVLAQMPPALQSRYLEHFLKQNGVPEPEQVHISAARELLYSDKPSARMDFPGGVVIARDYDRLTVLGNPPAPEEAAIPVPGVTELPQWGIRVTCDEKPNGGFGVNVRGSLTVRSRKAGDEIRLPGGTKSIKKLMIDRKISAPERNRIPILADDNGVLWAGQFGGNLARLAEKPTHYILIETL